jgi:hypothetical protein
MKRADRMFGVIVLGGIALTSGATPALGCGGTVAAPADAGGSSDAFPVEGIAPPPDGFPQEGPAEVDAFPMETAQLVDTGISVDAFPQEGPAMIDSGMAFDGAVDSGADAFPQEGPAPPEAGPVPDAFPQETAQP